MDKDLKGFELYNIEPNSLHPKARLYTKTIFFNTKNEYKQRLIRVYLPSTYEFDNPNNRFPVIYMMDGKNLYDDYTSFVGEWGIDETIEEYIERGLSKGYIVVGIDAPNENKGRTLEMSFDNVPTVKRFYMGEGYANIFGDYIFETVKPEIDRTFYTLKDRSNTYVGGSSMGGLMAYYLASHYPERIEAALCFSPAFFLLNQTKLKEFLKITINKDMPNLFFYVGNIGFENVFVKSTKMVYEFYKNNLPNLKVEYIFDENMEHNEYAWRLYFRNALNFIHK